MPGMIPLLTADPFSIEMEGWPQSLLRPNSSEWGPKSLTNSIRSHSCNFCSRKPTTTHTFPFLVPHGTPKASKWCWQRPMNKINTHYWLVPFLSSTYKNKMAILRFLSPNWFGSREALWRRTVSKWWCSTLGDETDGRMQPCFCCFYLVFEHLFVIQWKSTNLSLLHRTSSAIPLVTQSSSSHPRKLHPFLEQRCIFLLP